MGPLQRPPEALYRAVVEGSADAIALLDAEGRILFVSGPIEPMTGYTPAELAGTIGFDLVHPDDVSSVREALRNAVATRVPVRIEYRSRHKDGSWRHRDVVGINRLDDPAIVGIVINFRDTSVRSLAETTLLERERQAAEALRGSQERLRLALEATALGPWDWDLRTNAVDFSPEWKRQIGYEPHEIPSRYEEWESRVHPSDRDRVLGALHGYLEGRQPEYVVEFRLRHKDGSYRWIYTRGSLLRNAAGEATHMLGCHLDITERKRIEDQFRQAQKMEAVGRLAGGIAHDFNNLLTAIVGYAELALAQVNDDDPLRSDIEQIRNAGHSAGSLTRQLLAFSRKQLLQPQIIDVNTIVIRMTGLLRRLIGEHIELRTRLTQPLGRVSADPGQIEQVILNLALNARDAMPRGGTLSIATANADLDESYVADHPGSTVGPHVMLAIRDTGIGMERAVQERLFEPFYTTKELGKGTGLGLATVYGIVKQSGGSIYVYSKPRRGTSFKVYLPSVQTALDNVPASVQVPTRLHGSETILLVEDQSETRSVAHDVLTRNGYRVLAAPNAHHALEQVRKHHSQIDLLLTDVVMPGISGRDLAEQFLRRHPHARVLYTSGYTDDSVLQQGILDQTVAFIQKPFTPMELLQKVRETLDADARPGSV